MQLIASMGRKIIAITAITETYPMWATTIYTTNKRERVDSIKINWWQWSAQELLTCCTFLATKTM